jgi:hypothetical protein
VTYLPVAALRTNRGVSILTTVRMLTPETNRAQWATLFFSRRRPPALFNRRTHDREAISRTARIGYFRRTFVYSSEDWISMRDCSVRCTGHFSEISSSFDLCSALSGPANSNSHAMRSRNPSFVSHVEQSSA